MKRLLSAFLALALCLTLLPLANPVNAASVEDLSYEISDGQVTIIDCNGSASGELVIPATIDGYPVTSIGDYAFLGRDSLTSVTIPDSVTSIGKNAFSYCNSLKDVYISDLFAWCQIKFASGYSNPLYYGGKLYLDNTLLTDLAIPEGVTSIGSWAFSGCASLTSVTIPKSVTSIGDYAFRDCSSLTSVTIPNSVTNIGEGAFSRCTSLTSVTIPDSITSLGWYAFSDCSSLASVTILDGVTSIGNGAFYDCDSLTSVTIPDGVTSIGDSAFWGCNNLTSVTISESVTRILSYAFEHCSSLKNVCISDLSAWCTIGFYSDTSNPLCNGGNLYLNNTLLTDIVIPEGVNSIGGYAFRSYSSLTSVTIPEGVTSIGYAAFSDCSGLTSVTIPKSVTSIGSAFSSCPNLTDVTISEGVTSIGHHAFSDCDSLASVAIPDSITSIGEGAFSDCSSLTSVTIPEGVTSIGELAFSSCNSLTAITVSKDNSNYSNDSHGALFDKNKTTLIQAPGAINGAYTIPDSVTSIGRYAFYNCTSLTSVTIPGSVTGIGNSAFNGCHRLTSVTIPDSVTSIGNFAFSYCDSLTSVTIPDSVTSIGYYAFSDCSSLTSVAIPDSITSIGEGAFSDCSSLTAIAVSKDNSNYSNDSHGVLFDKNKTTLVQAPGAINGAYTIPDGVTSIGCCAFDDCTSLTSVTIPGSVTSIEEDALSGCSSLTSVNFTGNAPTVHYGAFYGVYATAYYHAGTSGWSETAPSNMNSDWWGNSGEITLQEVDHIWSDYSYDSNATCTADGTERAVCLTCGAENVRTVEGSAGHRYQWGSCIDCLQPDPNPNRAVLSGSVTCYGFGAVQFTLTPTGGTNPAITQTSEDGTYSFQVAPGEYILTISQEGTATRTYPLTLTEGETTQDVKLHQPGDVTGDGRINVGDVAKIYAHSKRSALLTDEYQLLCADYNGDERINVGDAARVYAIVKGK